MTDKVWGYDRGVFKPIVEGQYLRDHWASMSAPVEHAEDKYDPMAAYMLSNFINEPPARRRDESR